MNVLTILGLCGTVVSIVAGALAIRKHFSPERKAEILSPTNQGENGGRYVAVSVSVPRRRRRIVYWIAVQPDDCRADGKWYPQIRPLTFDRNGSGSPSKIRLGREGWGGTMDVGKTFTVGLFEVTKCAQRIFSEYADRADPLAVPVGSKLVHAIEVRRVRS